MLTTTGSLQSPLIAMSSNHPIQGNELLGQLHQNEINLITLLVQRCLGQYTREFPPQDEHPITGYNVHNLQTHNEFPNAAFHKLHIFLGGDLQEIRVYRKGTKHHQPNELDGLNKKFAVALCLTFGNSAGFPLKKIEKVARLRMKNSGVQARIEVTTLQGFIGKQNICQLRDYLLYTGKNGIGKTIMYQDLYDSDLYSFWDKTLTKMELANRLPTLKSLFRQILQGAMIIHNAGYIHFDLKQENIFVKHNPNAPTTFSESIYYLGDFDGAQSLPVRQVRSITPGFVSPEVFHAILVEMNLANNNNTPLPPLTAKADLWSIGCIFLDMYTNTQSLWTLFGQSMTKTFSILRSLNDCLIPPNLQHNQPILLNSSSSASSNTQAENPRLEISKVMSELKNTIDCRHILDALRALVVDAFIPFSRTCRATLKSPLEQQQRIEIINFLSSINAKITPIIAYVRSSQVHVRLKMEIREEIGKLFVLLHQRLNEMFAELQQEQGYDDPIINYIAKLLKVDQNIRLDTVQALDELEKLGPHFDLKIAAPAASPTASAALPSPLALGQIAPDTVAAKPTLKQGIKRKHAPEIEEI